MTALFIILLVLVLYTYVGYYALIFCFSFLKTEKVFIRSDFQPTVTLIISAYNEEKVIRRKIENSLQLSYPRERLEIIVVSDASTDDTDAIVRQYSRNNVKLVRMDQRGGKTVGLNTAVLKASGDIIIFSDANAMYRPTAVFKLVRHFADPEIGFVTGESVYTQDILATARDTEDIYWNYERKLKLMESRIGSMVGADGAIYAVRKNLYSTLKSDAINDFVNPLMIVMKGYRGVYDMEAVCYEDAAGEFLKEFSRKRRIVNRSWHGLMSVKEILNPLQYGFFALKVISHKMLRWIMPFILVAIFLLSAALSAGSAFFKFVLILQLLFYLVAAIGYNYRNKKKINFLIALPFYFCLVNFAAASGIIDSFRGKIAVTWETTRANK
jgi:cellulose synthase/poly-beta-1,6-N-acetylglucosamine synthase-like glycosyltransferase